MEDNSSIIFNSGKKHNFLFDTSTIRYFEEMYRQCGASIFFAMSQMEDVNFFACNEVLSELMNGPGGFNPANFNIFFNHILSSESSMNRDRKENRFLINEDGEVKYIVLNKISATDYAQILLCQNHPELVIVANDRKLIKSGAQVIPSRRVIGIPALLNRLLKIYPDNERIKALKKTGDEMYIKKHAFGADTQ